MAKSKKKVAAKPVKKSAAPKKKTAAKKVVKPAVKKKVVKSAKPLLKKAAKPIAKKVVPASKAKVKPASKSAAKPKAKQLVKARPLPKVKELLKKIVKPVAKLMPKVQGKPVVKPIAKSSVNTAKNKNQELRTRYSDAELEEFKQLILEKLEAAKKELKYLQDQINRKGDNGTDDTENKFASSVDGSSSMEREYLNQMAARQIMYLDHLDKALVRIQNKTYGICRVTGKLIEKDRLRAVPHATLSMEAKLIQSHS